jgi:hypothetical protein
MMDLVGSRPDTQTEVERLLASLAKVEVRLDDLVLEVAGIKVTDKGDVELYQGGVETDLRRAGSRLCYQLALIFGLDQSYKDPFSGSRSFQTGYT